MLLQLWWTQKRRSFRWADVFVGAYFAFLFMLVGGIVYLNMSEQLADLKGHPIEVATMIDNPPFSFYRNNRWTGLEVELMQRFSLFVGRPVHFSGYLFEEIVDVLLTRNADAAAANLFITPDRADKVLFSHPYYLCKTSCFSKAR